MITYEVKYKRSDSLFWKKLKKVKGDGFVENKVDIDTQRTISSKNNRWFILEDETRIEIPSIDHIFIFSKERHYSIKDRMESEINTTIKTDPR